MLDEYTDEFGTNLESRMPEFNEQPLPGPAGEVYQPRPAGARLNNPQAQQYQVNPQYQQPPPPQQQPPIYQQYVYQPPPVPPVQQAYQPPPRAQDRINTVFAEESQELNNLLKAEDNSGCLKNLLFLLVCLLVVVASFGLSYLVGAKLILPDNKQTGSSFSVTRGVKKIKRLLDSSDLLKDEKAFTSYSAPPAQTPPRTTVVVPPEVQYAPPAQTPPRAAVEPQHAAALPPPKQSAPPPVQGTLYRVIVGNFDTKQEAQDVATNVRADGFPVYMYMADSKYRLQIGAFKSKAAAAALLKKSGEYGYNAFISIK